MLVASVLFVVDGIFDGVYPGGPAWFTGKYDNLAEIAYVFAIVNTLVAYFVARGSERSLIARMSLSVFFLIERPLTAFVLGPKPITSIAKGRRPPTSCSAFTHAIGVTTPSMPSYLPALRTVSKCEPVSRVGKPGRTPS